MFEMICNHPIITSFYDEFHTKDEHHDNCVSRPGDNEHLKSGCKVKHYQEFRYYDTEINDMC